MRCQPWMNSDERSPGTRISDLQTLAKNLRDEAARMEKRANEMRQQAKEAERRIENLRIAR